MTLTSLMPRTLIGWTFTAILTGGAGFALAAHWTHSLGVLPYLLILACPLMHLFMHGGGHGGHAGHEPNGTNGGTQARNHGGAGCHSEHRPKEKGPSSQNRTING